ncbi:hypothetical protein M3Y97_00895600 [Aphelenchoides bicaudatus]|nr:hypothetical protein M3Y97_00895600 [Aphelenchoides bicaudatus]
MNCSFTLSWSCFFKQVLLAAAALMLFSDCFVNSTILCADKGYKSCAHSVSERDLRVLIPAKKHVKRAFFYSFASNRRAAQPCRWKLCGASYNYQGSKRRL